MMYGDDSVVIIAQYHNICGLDCPRGYAHYYDWFAEGDYCRKYKSPQPEPDNPNPNPNEPEPTPELITLTLTNQSQPLFAL